MYRYPSQKILTDIASALQQPAGSSQRHLKRFYDNTLAEGGALEFRIDDLLYYSDSRLAGLNRDELLGVLRTPPGMMFWHPKHKKNMYGTKGLPSMDVAAMLVRLEKLGFNVNPEPLVTALLPQVRTSNLITASELEVLWHAKERHRAEVMVEADLSTAVGEITSQAFETAHKYKVEVARDAAGMVVRLTVRGPKRKKAQQAR